MSHSFYSIIYKEEYDSRTYSLNCHGVVQQQQQQQQWADLQLETAATCARRLSPTAVDQYIRLLGRE